MMISNNLPKFGSVISTVCHPKIALDLQTAQQEGRLDADYVEMGYDTTQIHTTTPEQDANVVRYLSGIGLSAVVNTSPNAVRNSTFHSGPIRDVLEKLN